MSDGFSLIKADGISEPATVLIQKISDAIGGYFKPYQIRRVAKAEADADIIGEQAQIEITDLHRRALRRFLNEEAKKQDNIESITEKAIPQLSTSATPDKMADDWITNFFDKCRIISDKEMQELWAKILSGEANSPGTFSKRTVNALGSLDKEDAQIFTKVCRFVVSKVGEPYPFIYDLDAAIYKDQQINFPVLSHLDDIGLITLDMGGNFQFISFPKQITFDYFGTTLVVEFSNPENNNLTFGKVVLTKIGAELSKICEAKPIDGLIEHLIDKWSKQGLHVALGTTINYPVDNAIS